MMDVGMDRDVSGVEWSNNRMNMAHCGNIQINRKYEIKVDLGQTRHNCHYSTRNKPSTTVYHIYHTNYKSPPSSNTSIHQSTMKLSLPVLLFLAWLSPTSSTSPPTAPPTLRPTTATPSSVPSVSPYVSTAQPSSIPSHSPTLVPR